MSAYLLVKYLHVLSAILLLGTAIGSTFYVACANRWGDVATRAFVTRLVIVADLVFTVPAIVLQPVTGAWLAKTAGWGMQAGWLRGALLLYLLVGVFWTPKFLMQIRMYKLAHAATHAGARLPPAHSRWARLWAWLSYPSFAGAFAILYLMVAKPDF